MKGLEATEIQLSELEDTFRLDAEYHSPRFLAMEELLNKKQPTDLETLGRFIPGPFGSAFHVADFEADGTHRYVRGKDVKPFFVTNADNVYVPAADFQRMKEFALQENDVLISVVGTLGNASLVTLGVLPAIYSCKSTVFRPDGVDARYLVTYLNSDFGRSLLLRKTRGTVQTGLNLPDLKSVLLPRFSKLEDAIAKCLSLSESEANDAETLYNQAETLLLEALNLQNWQPPQPLTYASTCSAAFAAGRLDAEHFQPQYAALIEHLQIHAPRLNLVKDFAAHCDRGEQPKYFENGTLAVVNSRHILENGLDYDNFERTDSSFWNNPSFHSARIQKHDILIYTTGGFAKKPGRTAIYLEDERALASNHVNLLRLREENPVYVAVVLNSMIGRMQAAAASTGSIQQEIYPSDIANFTIPFVDEATESAIVAATEKSHTARRRAKALLEAAKRAVEIAIETDEEAALAHLENVR